VTDTGVSLAPHSTNPHMRGATFHYWAGQGVLLCPDPEAPDQRWLVWNTTTRTISPMVVEHVDFDRESTSDDDLVAGLVSCWQASEQARQRVEEALEAKVELIADVRQYAIDRFLDGSICQDGLNSALEHFNVDPFEPRYRVPLIVNGVVEINADDSDEAARRVRYLLDGLAISGERDNELISTELGNVAIGDIEMI